MKKNIVLMFLFSFPLSLQSQSNQTYAASLGVAGVALAGTMWTAYKYATISPLIVTQKTELTQVQMPSKELYTQLASARLQKRKIGKKLGAAQKCLRLNQKFLANHKEKPNSQKEHSELLSTLKTYQTPFPEIKPAIAQYEAHTHECEVEQKRDADEKLGKKSKEICYAIWKPYDVINGLMVQKLHTLSESRTTAHQRVASLLTDKPSKNREMAQYSKTRKEKQAAICISENNKNNLKTARNFFGIAFLSALTYYFWSNKPLQTH
jgi:hypothetical protein